MKDFCFTPQMKVTNMLLHCSIQLEGNNWHAPYCDGQNPVLQYFYNTADNGQRQQIEATGPNPGRIL